MNQPYQEFRAHVVHCWGHRLQEQKGDMASFRDIQPSADEICVIVDALTYWFIWDLIHGLPVDLIRLFTVALRNGDLLNEVALALLTAPFNKDAMRIMARLRSIPIKGTQK